MMKLVILISFIAILDHTTASDVLETNANPIIDLVEKVRAWAALAPKVSGVVSVDTASNDTVYQLPHRQLGDPTTPAPTPAPAPPSPPTPGPSADGLNIWIYKYYDIKRTWDDAEAICKGDPNSDWKGGHLVSIHSEKEDKYMRTLWAKYTNAGNDFGLLWIGLSDKNHEGFFQWTDSTRTNYYAWRAGEPNSSEGNNEDCVNMYLHKTDDTTGHKGLDYRWNDNPCGDKLPFVCRKPVDPSKVACPPGQKCLVLLQGTDPDIAKDISTDTCPDDELAEVVKSPCFQVNRDAHGTPLPSCCTSEFVNAVLENDTIKLVMAIIKVEKCKDAVLGAVCGLCSYNQQDFMWWNEDPRYAEQVLNVNMCTETCVSVYESCKEDKGLMAAVKAASIMIGGNPFESAETLCTYLDDNLDVVRDDKFTCSGGSCDGTENSKDACTACGGVYTPDPYVFFNTMSHATTLHGTKTCGAGCYLYDNLSPAMIDTSPKSGAKNVPTDTHQISLVFNEGVQIGTLAGLPPDTKLKICEAKNLADDKCDPVLYDIDLTFNNKVFTHTTTFYGDTVEVPVEKSMDVSGKASCIFASGTNYKVSVPAGVISDPAGNTFAGSAFSWTFTTANNPECRAPTPAPTAEKGGGGSTTTIVVVLVLLMAIAGGGFFVWHRKKMQNKEAEAPQEGDVVQTAEGTHQVRLVPVFQPPAAGQTSTDAPAEEPPSVGKKGGLAGADSLARSEDISEV